MKQNKITKNDRYSLNTPIDQIPTKELRDLYFGLSFRMMSHLQRGHTEAFESAQDLLKQLKIAKVKRTEQI